MSTNNNYNKLDDVPTPLGKLEGQGTGNTDDISDDVLFKQPPPSEDCPICNLLLPALSSGSVYKSCCGKIICCGCVLHPCTII